MLRYDSQMAVGMISKYGRVGTANDKRAICPASGLDHPYDVVSIGCHDTRPVMTNSASVDEDGTEGGFTLLELAIVLVIIGLLVGGILVGVDLIKAAEVRATVGQIESYNAMVNTFRTKYSAIPGDIAPTQAAAVGLFNAGMTGAVGLGDANNILEGGLAGGQKGRGENLIFWRHLSDANLIGGMYGQDLVAATVTSANSPQLYYPPAKIGRGNYVIVSGLNAVNYYLIGSITAQAVGGAYTFSVQITPKEAFSMDIKLDDGLPNLGNVQAHGTNASSPAVFGDAAQWSSATTPTSGDCVTTGSGAVDIADTYANTLTAPGCMLRFRFN